MKALHLLGNGNVEIAEYPVPQPDETQVLVRVAASGVCGSEMGAVRGDNGMEMNAGHEVSGVIADPNGHAQWQEGDRVGVFTLQGCGKCHWCRAGQATFCDQVGTPSATHSEYCVSKAHSLVSLPEDVSMPIAVLLCGDGLGVPYGASMRAQVDSGDLTCVFGCGPVGLGMVLVQAHTGAHVIAVEPSKPRRDLAMQMGAWQTIDPTEVDDMAGLLKEMTDGDGPDKCFECSGRQDTLDIALTATRPEGLIVMVGHGPQTMDPQKLIIKKNLRMMGNWVAHPGWYPDMLQLYRGGLPVERLVTDTLPFDRAQEAYTQMLQQTCGKLILTWD